MSLRWTGTRCHECGAPLDLAWFHYQGRDYCDQECARLHIRPRPIAPPARPLPPADLSNAVTTQYGHDRTRGHDQLEFDA